MILIASLLSVGYVMFFSCTVRVNIDAIFQHQIPVQNNTHAKNPVNSLFTNALAKMHQLRAIMTRQLLLELLHAAKSLVIRIALPLQYYRFVTQIL